MTSEDRYRCSRRLGAQDRYTHTHARTHDHCFPFHFWRRREATQKLEPLPPAAESWGTSRAGCGPPADARGPRGREGPVPPGGSPQGPKGPRRAGPTTARADAAGGSYVGTPGTPGRRPWEPGPGGGVRGVAWTHQVPRLLRGHGSGGSRAKRAEGGRSGGLATGRAARPRREPGAGKGSGRGAPAGGGAMGRGGAEPAASVTRARASLSQGCPTTCRGTSSAGSGCSTLGREGQGMRPGLLSARRPEALPREGRKWAGPGQCPRAVGGSRDCGRAGTGSGRDGAVPAEACSRGARPCSLVVVSPAADQRLAVHGARTWERTVMGPG